MRGNQRIEVVKQHKVMLVECKKNYFNHKLIPESRENLLSLFFVAYTFSNDPDSRSVLLDCMLMESMLFILFPLACTAYRTFCDSFVAIDTLTRLPNALLARQFYEMLYEVQVPLLVLVR